MYVSMAQINKRKKIAWNPNNVINGHRYWAKRKHQYTIHYARITWIRWIPMGNSCSLLHTKLVFMFYCKLTEHEHILHIFLSFYFRIRSLSHARILRRTDRNIFNSLFLCSSLWNNTVLPYNKWNAKQQTDVILYTNGNVVP